MLTGIVILVSLAAFVAGVVWHEWRSLRKTARYLAQFNTDARPNSRKEQP